MIQLTDEQRIRLNEVRENRRVWHGGMGQVTRDIDFLLSLLDSDSQAAARNDTNKTAWQIVQRYYPDDDELATAIKEALDSVRTGPQIETLLSSEVAWKIARHIAGKNSDYFSMREGLAELESIINLHFANAALSSAATAMRDKCVAKVREIGAQWMAKYQEDSERFNHMVDRAIGAEELEKALESLTLEEVKPGEV